MFVTYITYEQLYKDTVILAGKFPERPNVVIGIPRSGMVPAAMLAKHFDCQLVGLKEFCDYSHWNKKQIVLVDDSLYRGTAMREAVAIIKLFNPDAKFERAVVYGHPEMDKTHLDYCSKEIPSRRYFEWNLMQHEDLKETLSDLDGVFCEDPPQGISDNDFNDWMDQAKPLFIPKWKLGGIVTMRLVFHREQTQSWLKRNRIEYQNLIMCPCATSQERRAGISYGRYKGEIYEKSSCKLFIESSASQAKEIASVSKKPVICLEDSKVYQMEELK